MKKLYSASFTLLITTLLLVGNGFSAENNFQSFSASGSNMSRNSAFSDPDQMREDLLFEELVAVLEEAEVPQSTTEQDSRQFIINPKKEQFISEENSRIKITNDLIYYNELVRVYDIGVLTKTSPQGEVILMGLHDPGDRLNRRSKIRLGAHPLYPSLPPSKIDIRRDYGGGD